MKLIYNINDKPKFGKLLVFAIQQVLAIITATIVVPIITNSNAGLEGANQMSSAAALFGAGVGTLVYLLFTKGKSPVFLGSSFAFLGSMAAAFAGATTVALGYVGLIIGAILAGLVYVIIAIIVKFAGSGWLNKLMPAVVIGPTVAIIGLSLAGNAVGDLQKSAITSTLNGYVVEAQEDYDLAVKLSGAEQAYEDAKAELEAETDPSKKALLTLEVASKKAELETLKVVCKEAGFETFEQAENALKSAKTKQNINILICIACGVITLLVTVICSTFGKKMVKLIPFICGIGAGYGLALVLTVLGKLTGAEVLQVINFQPFIDLYTNFVENSKLAISCLQAGELLNACKALFGASTSFVALPEFTFVKAFGVFGQEVGGIQGVFSYLVAVAIAYVPVAFVVFAEHVADHKNISSIIEKDLLEEPGLHRTLLGDGVGSMAGALFGGCPNTTYGESVACVAITRNASVATILTAAVLAIIISFLSPFVALVQTIPSFVMGGVCVALYGFIAVSGLKMIQKVDLGLNKNLFVVATILITGIGGLTLTFGQIQITSIACALILGIIVNLILNKAKETEETAE